MFNGLNHPPSPLLYSSFHEPHAGRNLFVIGGPRVFEVDGGRHAGHAPAVLEPLIQPPEVAEPELAPARAEERGVAARLKNKGKKATTQGGVSMGSPARAMGRTKVERLVESEKNQKDAKVNEREQRTRAYSR